MYYLRYITSDDQETTVNDVLEIANSHTPGFTLEDRILSFNGRELALISISRAGDKLFDIEIAEFIEFAKESEAGEPGQPKGLAKVLERLESASEMFAFQVLNAGEEESYDLLEPVWDALNASRGGMLQADAIGYFIDGKIAFATAEDEND